jgi:hypothetical protein
LHRLNDELDTEVVSEGACEIELGSGRPAIRPEYVSGWTKARNHPQFAGFENLVE